MYQEAEPYQTELRQHAQSFLRALQQAGFSLEGILNGVPEEKYICSLNSDISGKLQPSLIPCPWILPHHASTRMQMPFLRCWCGGILKAS